MWVSGPGPAKQPCPEHAWQPSAVRLFQERGGIAEPSWGIRDNGHAALSKHRPADNLTHSRIPAGAAPLPPPSLLPPQGNGVREAAHQSGAYRLFDKLCEITATLEPRPIGCGADAVRTRFPTEMTGSEQQRTTSAAALGYKQTWKRNFLLRKTLSR